ncbi:sulfite exporter TauE/SafE family protein [Roseovarius sp. LXJ103]|uniref:sulfite exporter TauE/SafE family protein n=1 Tax=Roseovarius carneus TaxID=2853164 RepID=UPI000D60E160|nr:sulfite exporter TauE/SafE family protein [Roseovarius carneus]MBZ8117273.1 sulfite exporter TauE/SafE family protein [Roseovarius carneus]PWE36901.1 hypothetical protein DD563_13640 [Pelagicola sp. LXJ1103]
MELLSGQGPLLLYVFAGVMAILAGMVKGLVGFGMPMILISGLSTIMPPDVALAGLIGPTLVTNLWQALRQGPGAAVASVRMFAPFMVAGAVTLVLAAQLVPHMRSEALLLIIAVPITGFALLMLLGRELPLPAQPGRGVQGAIGALSGCLGGMTGVWGPTTVAMLTAMQTEKRDQIRIQGVIYGSGAVLLAVAHFGSGVLNAATVGLSFVLIAPAILGQWLGLQVQDRIDQVMFRRLTLIVLLLAGLNLLRRGVMGG